MLEHLLSLRQLARWQLRFSVARIFKSGICPTLRDRVLDYTRTVVTIRVETPRHDRSPSDGMYAPAFL
jgi:hypothetical protein